MPNSKIRNPHAPLLLILSALLGCNAQEPALVGSNAQSLTIDKVDILLVVDDSASMADFKQEELRATARARLGFSPGVRGDRERARRCDEHQPRRKRGAVEPRGEQPWAPRSRWMEPSQRRTVPSSNAKVVATTACSFHSGVKYRPVRSAVSDLRLARPRQRSARDQPERRLPASLTATGCGYEQPLEAALKALWPATDTSVEFLYGEGHGAGTNAGFLRDDSLLIVVVITDEDDCSAEESAAVPARDTSCLPVTRSRRRA